MSNDKMTLRDMEINAMCNADRWFAALPLQQQLYVQELAGRVANQFSVMIMSGDRRAGIDKFPDAWATVKNPPLNLGELSNEQR